MSRMVQLVITNDIQYKNKKKNALAKNHFNFLKNKEIVMILCCMATGDKNTAFECQFVLCNFVPSREKRNVTTLSQEMFTPFS